MHETWDPGNGAPTNNNWELQAGHLQVSIVKPEKNHMSRCKNVFEAILRYGHDEDFVPNGDENFTPTDAPAGSPDKIEVLRRRVELGQPLWHTTDRVDYSGLTGAIRPRE